MTEKLPLPDLEADEDRIAYLEDLVVFNMAQTQKSPIRHGGLEMAIQDAKGQLEFLRQKIETGDGTCGSGMPFPYCLCDGCRYERGELRAESLEEALARRHLKEGDGYIYYMRGRRIDTLSKAGKALMICARLVDGDTDFDTVLFKLFTDLGFETQMEALGAILEKLPEDDLDQMLGAIPLKRNERQEHGRLVAS